VYSHKRVLVALDGSPSAEAVLRFVLDIAGPLDMTVQLLRVLEPVPTLAVEGTIVSGFDDLELRRHEAAEYLTSLVGQLRAKGVTATCEVREGRAATEILAAARASKADLIAMATHGRTGLGRLLFGSVAEEVLRQASIPVFMIRQPESADVLAAAQEGAAR